ncbi:MAG: HAD-IIA family hydrolase [Candidatus Lokiarchaeota archaeon]|nr:HAD-IIA family hydrolase [Candidatus Lokiarchaeota archaeon]
MSELIKELQGTKIAIFDLDGVIYRGTDLIPNVDKIIQRLTDLSIKIAYNSNNSTKTRQMYADHLKTFNISSKSSDFYTSASITSEEITRIKPNSNIFVIGEIGLREELKAKGHKIISSESDYSEVDFVIVGLDRNFNYNDLAIAQRCILEGKALFYATNDDATLPVKNRFLPGAGVMVKALEVCTGKKPIATFGKPQPSGIELILRENNISPKHALMFGDRLNTDIIAGNRAGVTTLLVLTGVTSSKDVEDVKKDPTNDRNLLPNMIIDNLDAIFE